MRSSPRWHRHFSQCQKCFWLFPGLLPCLSCENVNPQISVNDFSKKNKKRIPSGWNVCMYVCMYACMYVPFHIHKSDVVDSRESSNEISCIVSSLMLHFGRLGIRESSNLGPRSPNVENVPNRHRNVVPHYGNGRPWVENICPKV